MASHGADPNEATNFPSTVSELLKILPKRETKLQIRLGTPSSAANSSSNNNNSSRQHHNNNNHHSHNNHHNNRNNNNNSANSNHSPSSQNNPCYHTLRYDFKPASVNSEEPASLELTSNGQVTIKAPNFGGSISNQTVFRGQRRPHVKECLLVIDHSTGEMVLQKLTDNITVKATRNLGGGGVGGSGGGGGGGGSSSSNGGGGNLPNQAALPPNSAVQTALGNGINNTNNVVSNSNNNDNSGSSNNANNSHNHNNIASGNIKPLAKIDGPQLSEESSSSSDSSSSSRSRTSSSSSSSSSSNSGNSSPNNGGFTF